MNFYKKKFKKMERTSEHSGGSSDHTTLRRKIFACFPAEKMENKNFFKKFLKRFFKKFLGKKFLKKFLKRFLKKFLKK
jgi:hypothetical protein